MTREADGTMLIGRVRRMLMHPSVCEPRGTTGMSGEWNAVQGRKVHVRGVDSAVMQGLVTAVANADEFAR